MKRIFVSSVQKEFAHVRKLFRYTPDYAGANPRFQEGDVFRITVPIKDEHIAWGTIPPLPNETVTPTVVPTVAPTITTTVVPVVAIQGAPSDMPSVVPSVAPSVMPSVASLPDDFSGPRFHALLRLLKTEQGAASILSKIDIPNRVDLVRRYLNPLLSAGLIERTVPDKPTSRFQKYRLTPAGRAALASLPR